MKVLKTENAKDKSGKLVVTIEHLECGHVNNLSKHGKKDKLGNDVTRTSGVCPKGCT